MHELRKEGIIGRKADETADRDEHNQPDGSQRVGFATRGELIGPAISVSVSLSVLESERETWIPRSIAILAKTDSQGEWRSNIGWGSNQPPASQC